MSPESPNREEEIFHEALKRADRAEHEASVRGRILWATLATLAILAAVAVIGLLGVKREAIPTPADGDDSPMAVRHAVQFLSVPPGATISIEGRTESVANRQTIQLTEGNYTVTFRKNGYRDYKQTFAVDGTRPAFTAFLEPLLARIALTSDPAGAEVWQEGRKLGVTPYHTSLMPGSYTFEVIKNGYEPRLVTAEIRPGEPWDSGRLVLPAIKPNAVNPLTATKDRPFVNSLGMKFVPVPITGGPSYGERVLFSVWETRVKDYATYAKANSDVEMWWKDREYSGHTQGPDHPVIMVRWEDAQGFVQWLSRREHLTYRLPSVHEWICAVGSGNEEDAAPSPLDKSRKIDGVYPYGREWPPPRGAGNFKGEEFLTTYPTNKVDEDVDPDPGFTIEGYEDDHPFTAPVGSYAANEFGLHDLGGNVSEWCSDLFSRGGSWLSHRRPLIREISPAAKSPQAMSERRRLDRGRPSLGFRCVLVADWKRLDKPMVSELAMAVENEPDDDDHWHRLVVACANMAAINLERQNLEDAVLSCKAALLLLPDPLAEPEFLQRLLTNLRDAEPQLALAGDAAKPAIPVNLPAGSIWRYLDGGADPGAPWLQPDFDDSAWAEGAAPLGYEESGISTALDFGGDPDDKAITYHFRTRFQVEAPGAIGRLAFTMRRDDGIVVYLNGQELIRDNMPRGGIDATTSALTAAQEGAEGGPVAVERTVPAIDGMLVSGNNVLGVTVHQAAATSSDLFFDLSLLGLPSIDPESITRTPGATPWLGTTLRILALEWNGKRTEALDAVREALTTRPEDRYWKTLRERLQPKPEE